MKIALKILVASMTIAIGFFLGSILLSDMVLWKILLFVGACVLIGQIVYKVLRIIDKRYDKRDKYN